MVKILLLEDDKWLSELESESLRAEGYKVAVVHNGYEAIEKIDDFKPDVIIADVLLAGSTVFTLLNELQSHGDTQIIPVILCSSVADQFSIDKLRRYGVVRVVDKTTMPYGELSVAVKTALGG